MAAERERVLFRNHQIGTVFRAVADKAATHVDSRIRRTSLSTSVLLLHSEVKRKINYFCGSGLKDIVQNAVFNALWVDDV